MENRNASVEEIRNYMNGIFEENEVNGMSDKECKEFWQRECDASEFIEAREWAKLNDETDEVLVADIIIGWHEGYRCEAIEVPEEILLWAMDHEDGNR